MKYSKKCEHCGHQVTAYTYNLNVGKVRALRRLVDLFEKTGKPIDLGDLGLTNSQYTNFCHLQYWDLVRHIPEGWIPTTRGIQFVYCETTVLVPVAVMNSEILPLDHEAWKTHDTPIREVLITDIDEYAYKKRPEYARERSATLF